MVVVAEFGDLCAVADDAGVLKEVIVPLQSIMRLAGATGIHMVIEDQSVEKWPRGIVVNAAPVTGKLPLNYGSTGGYYNAHQLQPYTFHYAGQTFKTFDMRAALPVVLAGMPRVSRLVSGERSTVPVVTVEGESTRENSPATPLATPPATPAWNAPALPEPGKWYDFILSYMATEKGRGLWLSPAEGVRELARAMSVQDTGSEAAEETYLSTASRTAKAIRSDIHLPNGDPLGTDITVTAQ